MRNCDRNEKHEWGEKARAHDTRENGDLCDVCVERRGGYGLERASSAVNFCLLLIGKVRPKYRTYVRVSVL